MKAIISAVLLGLLNTAVAQNNPVIVELFTSQGCSSCPAADRNLTEILAKSQTDGSAVYGLSFHVDYWNYIGWKDPYSSKIFTERQRSYAEVLKLQSIYTPQMIVNGQYEFVGSNKGEADRAIKNSLGLKSAYKIKIDGITREGNHIIVLYSIGTNPKGEFVNLAVVEKRVENFVAKGENRGKQLHHDNVVRAFKTVALQEHGSIELEIDLINTPDASLILYIQNKQFQVLSAASVAL